jgi:hypothetical protein
VSVVDWRGDLPHVRLVNWTADAPGVVGPRVVAIALLAAVLAAGAALPEPAHAGLDEAVQYLKGRQATGGGFSERTQDTEVGLTAWASLGLRAAGKWPRRPNRAANFLVGRDDATVGDLALRILALAALDRGVGSLADRLLGHRRPSGRIGQTVSSTIWGTLALRAARRAVPAATVRWLRDKQASGGGWPSNAGDGPDANATASAVQALRAAGVARSVALFGHAFAFLRDHQNADGGFEPRQGDGSNARTSAWAVQAFLAGGRKPGRAAFDYLRGLQRDNGSFRMSAGVVSRPAWVTAQVTAALARRPFPVP